MTNHAKTLNRFSRAPAKRKRVETTKPRPVLCIKWENTEGINHGGHGEHGEHEEHGNRLRSDLCGSPCSLWSTRFRESWAESLDSV